MDAGSALRRLQALHEDLDGPADAYEGHRLTGVVEDEGQVRVLVADLPEDLLGEIRRLGEGDRRELPHLGTGDVMPGRAYGDGPVAGLHLPGRLRRAPRHGQCSWSACSYVIRVFG